MTNEQRLASAMRGAMQTALICQTYALAARALCQSSGLDPEDFAEAHLAKIAESVAVFPSLQDPAWSDLLASHAEDALEPYREEILRLLAP